MGKYGSDYTSWLSQLSDKILNDSTIQEGKKSVETFVGKQSRKSAISKLLMGVAVIGVIRWLRKK